MKWLVLISGCASSLSVTYKNETYRVETEQSQAQFATAISEISRAAESDNKVTLLLAACERVKPLMGEEDRALRNLLMADSCARAQEVAQAQQIGEEDAKAAAAAKKKEEEQLALQKLEQQQAEARRVADEQKKAEQKKAEEEAAFKATHKTCPASSTITDTVAVLVTKRERQGSDVVLEYQIGANEMGTMEQAYRAACMYGLLLGDREELLTAFPDAERFSFTLWSLAASSKQKPVAKVTLPIATYQALDADALSALPAKKLPAVVNAAARGGGRARRK